MPTQGFGSGDFELIETMERLKSEKREEVAVDFATDASNGSDAVDEGPGDWLPGQSPHFALPMHLLWLSLSSTDSGSPK